jgi:type I restriction enzyme, S subunit
LNIETFLEKFDQFVDAPNAVTMTRNLVIQLAVQGKLVEQRLGDEPAENLVRRVAASLSSKKSENPFLKEIAPTITAETTYELPNGWMWLPLGCVGIWATGCGFPKQYQGETEGEFLFCKVSDMNLPGNEVEIRTTVNTLDREIMRKIRARVNPAGTVIFPKIGGAIATNKRRLVIKPTIIDNNCSGIQPIGLTDSRWLLQLLRSIDLAKYQSGTSVPAVSHGALNPIRIGLPPLPEQKRIVAKVDELMALCDRLEGQLQERDTRHAALARSSLARFAEATTPANLNYLFHDAYAIEPADLRKIILALAVEGKLVSRNPDEEPAGVLASELSELRKQHLAEGRIRGQKVSEFQSEQEFPFCIPDSWKWIRLGLAVTLLGGYAYESGTYVPRSSNQIIRLGNVKNDELLLDQKPAYIPDSTAEKTKAFEIRAGDILITMTGTKAKRDYAFTSVVSPDHLAQKRLFLNQRVGAIRPFREELIPLINMFLKAEPLLDLIFARATGTANQANIGAASILDLPFPLPPLSEQRRIVAKVDQLIALVDQLEVQLAASRETATSLMNAVVAELSA